METPAAELEFAADAQMIHGRTPYALLQEILSHNKLTPRPEFEISGPENNTSFTCTIIIYFIENSRSFSVTGNAASGKKGAQHSAAVAALNYMGIKREWLETNNASGNKLKWKIDNEKLKPLTGTSYCAPGSSPDPENSTENPERERWRFVLQEFCTDNQLEFPEFEVVDAKPPPHQPTFTMTCTVTDLRSSDRISVMMKAKTNQKQIRRWLAQKMLMKLHELKGLPWTGPPMPSGELLDMEDGTDIENKLNALSFDKN